MFNSHLPFRSPIRPASWIFWILAQAAVIAIYKLCHL